MGLIFLLLAGAGVCWIIVKLCDVYGENKYGKEGWEVAQKLYYENEQNKKYNNYMFTCPMCGSKKVKKIGDLHRTASVAMWGLASNKIGKQYECENCEHKW